MKKTELSDLSERLGISEGLLAIGMALLTMARVEGEGDCLCTSGFHNRSDDVRRNAFGKLVTVITANAQIRKNRSVSEFFKEVKASWVENAAAVSAVADANIESSCSINMLHVFYQSFETNNRPVMTSLGAKQEDVQKALSGGMIDQIILFYELPDVIVPMLTLNTAHFSTEKQAAILDALGAVIDHMVAVEDPETATLAALLG